MAIALDVLLKEEYFHLQKVIEDFDSKTITIKAWSVTGSLVVIGAGFTDKGTKELFLVAAFASLLFWVIEGTWKLFQLSYYARIKVIETYFANPKGQTIHPLQIYDAFGKSYKNHQKKRLFPVMFWRNILLPHLFIVIGGIALYLLTRNGVIVLPQGE
ncbi:hypothetical protein [Pedobacter caeni]|uniref:Uncharacterized protein n=1 Tax=Pedobacter caeni TaxID=288992 RepID=A0A1M5DR84_9SPHI|nr:hypothetical protein [Pedobacter caeni]SHF69470.1 hypothetical protein SAMN04488522_103349 [Pedobacter caeni]